MKASRVLAAAVLGAVLGASAARADITMAHDKDFWRRGLDAMAEAGGFEHVGYATDQYKAYLQSALSAGKPPDLFTWWTGNALADVVGSGQVAAVDALWDAKIAAGEFAPGTRELFAVGGKTYAIPMLLARWVMFYSKALFAEHGLSEPQSWAELERAAATLKAAGVTPFQATVQDGWRGFIWFSEILIRQDPAAYRGLHDGSVAYDSPAVEAAFDTWVDWYAKGYFSDPRSTREVEDFAAGGAAMYLMGEWAVGLLTENGMDLATDIGAFIVPNRERDLGPQVIVEGSPILISTAAWADEGKREAFGYWASAEGAARWADAQSLYNGNLKARAPNAVIQKISADMAAGGHLARNRWWEAVPSELQGDLVAELSAFMLDPSAERASRAMANMQALNAAYWAQQ